MAASWKKLDGRHETSLTGQDFAASIKTNSVKDEWAGEIIGRPIGRRTLEKQLALRCCLFSEELLKEPRKQFAFWWRERNAQAFPQWIGFWNDWKARFWRWWRKPNFPEGEWPGRGDSFGRGSYRLCWSPMIWINRSSFAKENLADEFMISAERQKVEFRSFWVVSDSAFAYPTSEMKVSKNKMSVPMRGIIPHFSRANGASMNWFPGIICTVLWINATMNSRADLFARPFLDEGSGVVLGVLYFG